MAAWIKHFLLVFMAVVIRQMLREIPHLISVRSTRIRVSTSGVTSLVVAWVRVLMLQVTLSSTSERTMMVLLLVMPTSRVTSMAVVPRVLSIQQTTSMQQLTVTLRLISMVVSSKIQILQVVKVTFTVVALVKIKKEQRMITLLTSMVLSL